MWKTAPLTRISRLVCEVMGRPISRGPHAHPYLRALPPLEDSPPPPRLEYVACPRCDWPAAQSKTHSMYWHCDSCIRVD